MALNRHNGVMNYCDLVFRLNITLNVLDKAVFLVSLSMHIYLHSNITLWFALTSFTQVIDLSVEKCKTFYKTLIQDNMLRVTRDGNGDIIQRSYNQTTEQFPVSGWMADFGEYVPLLDATLASGQDPMSVRNHWLYGDKGFKNKVSGVKHVHKRDCVLPFLTSHRCFLSFSPKHLE